MKNQQPTSPQQVLTATLAEVDRAQRENYEDLSIYDDDKVHINVSYDQFSRVQAVLTNLPIELDRFGISFLMEGGKLQIAKDTHRYGLVIYESARIVRTPLKRPQLGQEYETETYWSGRLVVRLMRSGREYKTWQDGKRTRFDTHTKKLAERIDRVVTADEANRQWHLDLEMQMKQRELIKAQNRYRDALNKLRYSFIDDFYGDLRHIDKITRIREQLHLMFDSKDDVYFRKIDKWLTSEIKRINAKISPKAIRARLAGSKMFDAVKL